MPRQRLLNCDFINDSPFKINLTNKAKLLYLYMFANADDRGFVGTTIELIRTLAKIDMDTGNQATLDLVPYTYKDALFELMDRGLIYEFKNKHNGRVHLIRHWYYHNHFFKKAWTNYGGYLKLVKLVNNEYQLRPDNEIPQDVEEQVVLEKEDLDWDKMIQDLENGNDEDIN